MVSCGISTSFPVLFPSRGKVAHALLTRPPLEVTPKGNSPLDLHVLSTPPAFVLSQDQTLMFNPFHSVALLPSARQSLRFLTTSWRFTHRILTVSISLPRSCLPALFASPLDPVLVSSVSFSRFARCPRFRVSVPCLADSFASITKTPSLVNRQIHYFPNS